VKRDEFEYITGSYTTHTPFHIICAIEGDINNMKFTLDLVVQELKKFSLEIDDRSLADGMCRNGHNH